MTHDDVLVGYRRRQFTLAEEIGVRLACRAIGVARSTYYALKPKLERYGLDGLRVTRAPPPPHAQPDRPPSRAADPRLCAGPSTFRVAADLGRAGPLQVGRDPRRA